MADLPYYIDDPLVDRAAHRLEFHYDENSTALGYQGVFGTCSCGEFVTPTWDRHGVMEAFDGHMEDVQVSAHAALTGFAALREDIAFSEEQLAAKKAAEALMVERPPQSPLCCTLFDSQCICQPHCGCRCRWGDGTAACPCPKPHGSH